MLWKTVAAAVFFLLLGANFGHLETELERLSRKTESNH